MRHVNCKYVQQYTYCSVASTVYLCFAIERVPLYCNLTIACVEVYVAVHSAGLQSPVLCTLI